jgi:type IV secretion system protein VirB9
MRKAITGFVCLGIPLCGWSADAGLPKPPHSVAGEPSLTARTVVYHQNTIVPITTAMFVETVVILPKGEKVLHTGVGDKDDWPVSWAENVLFIKSAAPGGKTTLNVFASSGTVYSFYCIDVSNIPGAHPDAKVFVQNPEVTPDEKPKFVSADELEAVQQQLHAAQQQAKTTEEVSARQAAAQEDQFRSSYPAKLHFDYTWDAKKGNALGIQQIFSDGRFTYIKADSQELPVVYEIQDGKNSLINAQYANGLFTIQKIVNQGEIVIGKKHLEFSRRAS